MLWKIRLLTDAVGAFPGTFIHMPLIFHDYHPFEPGSGRSYSTALVYQNSAVRLKEVPLHAVLRKRLGT